MCLGTGVRFEIDYAQAMQHHMKALTARERAKIIDGIEKHLMHEPMDETRHRKRLRENPIASHELRLGSLRVFYRVEQAAARVQILAIGRKIRDRLWIGDEVKL